MADSQIPPASNPANPQSRKKAGPITTGLLQWQPNGTGPYAWAVGSGPEAASLILLEAHALTACLSAAFSEDVHNSEIDALNGSYKALAMEGIGDLILLAKVLTDES